VRGCCPRTPSPKNGKKLGDGKFPGRGILQSSDQWMYIREGFRWEWERAGNGRKKVREKER